MMQLGKLSREAIEKIRSYRYDQIIEKHEGPERWNDVLDYYEPEFIEIDGKPVLLPVTQDHHRNITILRTTIDKDEKTLTVFLKDTTHVERPEDENFFGGFVAVCDKVPGEEFFIAIVYHEWFIIDAHLRPKMSDA